MFVPHMCQSAPFSPGSAGRMSCNRKALPITPLRSQLGWRQHCWPWWGWIPVSRNWLEATNSFPYDWRSQRTEIHFDSKLAWHLLRIPCTSTHAVELPKALDVLSKKGVQFGIFYLKKEEERVVGKKSLFTSQTPCGDTELVWIPREQAPFPLSFQSWSRFTIWGFTSCRLYSMQP